MRNKYGVCIPTEQCKDDEPTEEICQENEVFKRTGYDCANCRNYEHVKCPLILRPSCFCKDGYVRNSKNKCVSIEKCDCDIGSKCGPHEVFQRSGYECATCENYREAKCELKQRPGCFCREGYVRDRHFKCVPIEKCEVCGANEEFLELGSNCLTCKNWKYPSECANAPKKPGCYCKENYVRNRKGECVLKDSCDGKEHHVPKCDDNEQYLPYGWDCDVCDGKGDASCIIREKKGCYCLEGFVRNRYGRCVSKNQCQSDPSKNCGKNEIFKQSGIDCLTCQNYQDVECPVKNQADCYCIDGHVRNHRGECVPVKQCKKDDHKHCGAYELYKPAGYDCATCENYQYVKCPLLLTPDCYCINGYVRNKKGRCVSTDKCDNTTTPCGKNEIQKPTGYDCATCTNYKYVKCPLILEQACYCKSGFVRNSKGECVDLNTCVDIGEPPQECNVNETYCKSGNDCKTCKNPTGANCNESNKPGCYCSTGYVRDDHGICIKATDCTEVPPPTCPDGEVYNNCGTACPDTCENYQDTGRVCTEQCVKGCFCPEGQVRNSEGKCILPDKCPEQPTECPDGEIYKNCGTACPDTCENYQDTDRECTEQCVKGCFCPDGKVRNDNGKCVLPEECDDTPTECPTGEVYKECGTACPKTCENYQDTDHVCIDLCVKGCFCPDGQVRNEDGKCVFPQECEEPPEECPPGEVYNECGSACPLTCDNYKNPDRNCIAVCVKGCFCPPGKVRNSAGKCVPPKQCDNKCNKKNEVYKTCGCDEDCLSAYNNRTLCDEEICRIGCFCKDGYVRNPATKECIRKDLCPNRCGPNKEFRHCGCVETCDNYHDKKNCNVNNCESGCFCKNNMVLDTATNKCIPKHQCQGTHHNRLRTH